MFFAIEPNFEVTAKDVEKLFSFVRVRFATSAAGFDAKKMGLHGGLTPGQKFHADAGSGLQIPFAGQVGRGGDFRRPFQKAKEYSCDKNARCGAAWKSKSAFGRVRGR